MLKTEQNKYQLSVCDSVELLDSVQWDNIGKDNIYLSTKYLRAIEQTFKDLDFRYVTVYDQDQYPLLKAYFQLLRIRDVDEKYKSKLKEVTGFQMLDKLIPNIDISLMLCGNLYSCGEHGFSIDNKLDQKEGQRVLELVIDRISRSHDNNIKNSFILLKELYPESDPEMDAFSSSKFYPFHIDCNMILSIDPSWQSTDDYYNSMLSKFRTKARSVYRKSEKVEVKELSAEEIEAQSKRIDELHQNVLDKANFSMGEMTASGFVSLKKALGDKFQFKCYQLEGSCLGFSASIEGQDFLDAAYVGLDYDHVGEYALYQRILHDFVAEAISKGCLELRFGRTAEQVKSTLGAKPLDMRLYVKHRNKVVNHLLKPLVELIKPAPFDLRKPFKQNYEIDWTLKAHE